MRVFLTSPWIPAEWVRAHGLEARGIWFAEKFRSEAPPLAAGVCAFAESVVRFAETQLDAVVVFTTACDQLRRGFDAAAFRGSSRAFLFNLPATQTAVAAQIYRAELERLGQFLLPLGGSAPTPEILRREMALSDEARRRLREAAPLAAARSYAEAVARFHTDGSFSAPAAFGGTSEGRKPKSERNPKPEIRSSGSAGELKTTVPEPPETAFGIRNSDFFRPSGIRISDLAPVPLALVGGPLCVADWKLFDTIAAADGRVVLNATLTGERSLCPTFDRSAGLRYGSMAPILKTSRTRGPRSGISEIRTSLEPCSAGVLPAGSPSAPLGDGTGGETPPEPAAGDGRATIAPVQEAPDADDSRKSHPAPFDALAAGYFENLTDVFQRPNSRLYAWLKPRLLARCVRGIVLWHFTGCDLWRAEWQTLREVFGLPVLLLEADEAAGISPRDANRLQAFVEMLKQP